MTVYHFNMDNIINQELMRANNLLNKQIQEQTAENKRLKEALNEVALPSLKVFEDQEYGALKKLAEETLKKVLEILDR